VLIRRADLDRIATGEITLAFRRWRRPTVKTGGTLRTAVGLLRIDAVEVVPAEAVTEADARAAGRASRASLLHELAGRTAGVLYRIRLEPTGTVDPRETLQQDARLSAADVAGVRARLANMDGLSAHGPWTEAALRAIAAQPGRVSTAIALDLGFDRMWLKTQIRKLKALGLTESLEVGYRLSPRGVALLQKW
jgi:hypothetical protein